MAHKKWSALRPDTKRKYKAAGVTPQRFNAWGKKTPAQKREATKKAKAAGFAGTGREAFLGLKPHQISGADPMQLAFKRLEETFGDRRKFNPAGVRSYLRAQKEEEGPEFIKELASQSKAEIEAYRYPGGKENETHHYH